MGSIEKSKKQIIRYILEMLFRANENQLEEIAVFVKAYIS
jgi:hypothetical protein|nr:MAG TPA: hypothetical protein [Bacteriophage sp.]